MQSGVEHSVDSAVSEWIPIEIVNRHISKIHFQVPDKLTRNWLAMNDQQDEDYSLFRALIKQGTQIRSIGQHRDSMWLVQDGSEISHTVAVDQIGASGYFIFYVRDDKVDDFRASPSSDTIGNKYIKDGTDSNDSEDDFKPPRRRSRENQTWKKEN